MLILLFSYLIGLIFPISKNALTIIQIMITGTCVIYVFFYSKLNEYEISKIGFIQQSIYRKILTISVIVIYDTLLFFLFLNQIGISLPDVIASIFILFSSLFIFSLELYLKDIQKIKDEFLEKEKKEKERHNFLKSLILSWDKESQSNLNGLKTIDIEKFNIYFETLSFDPTLTSELYSYCMKLDIDEIFLGDIVELYKISQKITDTINSLKENRQLYVEIGKEEHIKQFNKKIFASLVQYSIFVNILKNDINGFCRGCLLCVYNQTIDLDLDKTINNIKEGDIINILLNMDFYNEFHCCSPCEKGFLNTNNIEEVNIENVYEFPDFDNCA